ncbi:MAG TPA: response regulator, partial [Candidatus Tectomicrobia bacterium]|nr:response regulator [Candidatus Tectomicrobia bacterium]
RHMVGLTLEDAGADVLIAGSLVEALAQLDGARVDVIVTDLGMPGGDGFDLLRAVRAREAGGDATPAVALTAFASAQDRERALAAGFVAHVPKPVEPELLIEVVASLLRDAPAR